MNPKHDGQVLRVGRCINVERIVLCVGSAYGMSRVTRNFDSSAQSNVGKADNMRKATAFMASPL